MHERYRKRAGTRAEVDSRAPRPDTGLVDESPTPETRQAAEVVTRALIAPVQRRAVAAFLESEDYRSVSLVRGGLMANLLLESLSGFVHHKGGQLALATRITDDGNIINPIQGTVTLGGETRRFLKLGFLFICLPGQRAVISAAYDGFPGNSNIEICVRSAGDPAAIVREWEQYARNHNYLLGRTFFADGEIIERSRRYSWDDILLSEAARSTIRTHVEEFLRHQRRLKSLGVKARRGVILSGPPGTGKTLLGKVLSDQLGTSFMWVLPRHIESVGSFDDILAIARFTAPAVVFLEDLDLFGQSREQNGWTGLGELMNQLDGVVDNEDIVTIATTNRLEVIEKALRNRPGRFDRVIEMDAMDSLCRKALLAKLLAGAAVSDHDMTHLIESTEDYTGAHLEELVNTLYIMAVQSDALRVRGAVSAAEGGDPEPPSEPRICLTRQAIDKAMEDVQVQCHGRLGFHVA